MTCPNILLKLYFTSVYFSAVKTSTVTACFWCQPSQHKAFFSAPIFLFRYPTTSFRTPKCKAATTQVVFWVLPLLLRLGKKKKKNLLSYHCTIHPQLDRRSSPLLPESCQKSTREINNLSGSRWGCNTNYNTSSQSTSKKTSSRSLREDIHCIQKTFRPLHFFLTLCCAVKKKKKTLQWKSSPWRQTRGKEKVMHFQKSYIYP